MTQLTFTSCQAPTAEAFCSEVVQFIGEQLGVRTEFVRDVPWQDRERWFDQGDIDVCWMCGWPYALRADGPSPGLDLIAAPVMADPHYLDRPVYFSDVVVRADSRYTTFAELRGSAWAYNEPRSHSGYNVVRHFIAGRQIHGKFFGTVIESGSHQASIDLIVNGAVSASAIDSTVLAAILRLRPTLQSVLRVIETIGPSPAPPWVMRSSLPRDLREALQMQFATMHESDAGRAILQRAGVKRFEAVFDRHYDAIRVMAETAAYAQL